MKKSVAVLLLAAVIAGDAAAAPPNVEKTLRGVLIHLDQAQIELGSANVNTLRLSVSLAGAPQPAPSSFLADTNADRSVAWTEIEEHGMVGIRTGAGKLLMNPTNGEWTLEDAAGKTVIPPHVIGNFQTSTNSSVSVMLGWRNHDPIHVYGCGDGVDSLLQSHVKTHVGNGVTVVPYYWSDTGYAVLAVTADDNQPAHWIAGANGEFVTWIFPGKTADLYLMPSATLKDAAKNYADLTGRAPVPPEWTFGYLQSRWGWTNRAYIEDTLKHFLKLKLPVDAFIYDFEWFTAEPDYSVPVQGTPGYTDFGRNTNLFPELARQIADYKSQGVHFVGIRKPRLGNAASLAMIRSNGWNLAMKAGNGFESRDLNFANPDLHQWYATQTIPLLRDGVDGWWNDEGEGSFTTYFYWNLAELEALQRSEPGHRLWTLNRAFSPGVQRFGAAAWTGDIVSSWQVLAETPTSLLNWTLAGMPYETCDIGGFKGADPSPELLSRWMEAGVFFPVMRSHSTIELTPRFPWLYGTTALRAIRQALDLRYRLIPFYYSLAHETCETGVPLMRPLVMEFPDDPKVANMSDEWIMGDSLLAAPVLQPGGQRSVYLPQGRWFAFATNLLNEGNQTINATANLGEIPIYVRAGSILPLAPIIQHTSELPGGALELEIYPGRDATFTLVEDDGETLNYQEGKIRRTTFVWDDAARCLTWKRVGDYDGKNVFKKMRIVCFAPGKIVRVKHDLSVEGSLTLRK